MWELRLAAWKWRVWDGRKLARYSWWLWGCWRKIILKIKEGTQFCQSFSAPDTAKATIKLGSNVSWTCNHQKFPLTIKTNSFLKLPILYITPRNHKLGSINVITSNAKDYEKGDHKFTVILVFQFFHSSLTVFSVRHLFSIKNRTACFAVVVLYSGHTIDSLVQDGQWLRSKFMGIFCYSALVDTYGESWLRLLAVFCAGATSCIYEVFRRKSVDWISDGYEPKSSIAWRML